MYNEALSQQLAVVATIDPDSLSAGAANSDAVDMSKFNRVLFLFLSGDLGTSATMDGKLQGSVDGSTGWTDLSGKSITQFTQAGSDSDKQALVEITAEELAGYGSGTYRYVRGVITIGTAASEAALVALGASARFHPASDDDLASVDEIVT